MLKKTDEPFDRFAFPLYAPKPGGATIVQSGETSRDYVIVFPQNASSQNAPQSVRAAGGDAGSKSFIEKAKAFAKSFAPKISRVAPERAMLWDGRQVDVFTAPIR